MTQRRHQPNGNHLTRRQFIRDTAALTAGLTIASKMTPESEAAASEPDFISRWHRLHDRVWVGRDYWANPLQDWRLAGGRLECVKAAPNRSVHLLTRQLSPRAGSLTMSVRLGRIDGAKWAGGKGSAGFRVGIQGPLRDYRNSLIFGTGWDAGLASDGTLFLGRGPNRMTTRVELNVAAVDLRLTVEPDGQACRLLLVAYEAGTGQPLGQVEKTGVTARSLAGNIALVANFPGEAVRNRPARPRTTAPNFGTGTFWFSDWRLSGDVCERHDDHAFGPILFSQYTLSGGILKLTAQMPPLGAQEAQTVRLQVRPGKTWTTLAEEPIHPEARTATFRIEKWNDRRDVPYRLAYTQQFADGATEEHHWSGVIRRDPVKQRVLTVADVSCNFHAAFPNAAYVSNMAKLNPDLLAFVGDQFYESTGGFGVERAPLDAAILDYLRKWYMHGWTWRELTRDRPGLSIPDDHDVYQGNVWGESGAARHGTQEMGGYDMPAAWVNVVHRTQTSHHPDPYDPTPAKQGISVYYGPMTYGRISFAILADRMFKSGPEGKVPPTGNRGDHVVDPNFDPRSADLPGLELLGERQMKFLREWAADWRGADLKAVVSQTIFTAMATTHGGNRERLRADYDANGWPQTPRNQALRELRKAFAFHLAGDQHLPAVVHYGVDQMRDAGVAFAGPAVNVGYPRWFEPAQPGANRAPNAPENTGDFVDHFGNPMTVLAVANGAVKPRNTVLEMMEDKASGLGLVRFDKKTRRITVECWPFLADPSRPGTQFPGWPVTVHQLDNFGGGTAARLPTLRISGPENPVLQVVDETNGETVYTVRLWSRRLRPPIFAAGKYTLRLSDPESGRRKEWTGVEALARNGDVLKVAL
jgi:alkaline phosphatase D